MMKLTVLNVAYPFAPVGPDAVGGAEQVLTQLDAGLTRNGHRSLVIACEESKVAGTILPTPRYGTGLITAATRDAAAQAHRAAIEKALDYWAVDIVHFHGVDFLDYLPRPGVKVLITLHLPISWYPAAAFQIKRPQTFLHCVSEMQQRDCPAGAATLPVIENGVPDELFVECHAKRSFSMCLGRICPEKGFHLALDAAHKAGVPLVLAGQVFPYEAHQRYFEREIVPRLDRSRRFIGPIGVRRKRRFLSAARCLLVPSLVPETSSLVSMEAFACGTPVIAFASGALAEMVEPGKNGFLVSNCEEMAQAIGSATELEPEACRATARARFSQTRMLAKYLRLYDQLTNGNENYLSEKGCGGYSDCISDPRGKLDSRAIGKTPS